MTLINKAQMIGNILHSKQTYGKDKLSYSYHLSEVFRILKQFNVKNRNILASSFLHDTCEDCQMNYELLLLYFNRDIAEMVWDVTKSESDGSNEINNYFEKISRNKNAILLKLADRIANVEECLENIYLTPQFGPSLISDDKSDAFSVKKYKQYQDEYLIFFEKCYIHNHNEKMWNHLKKLLNRRLMKIIETKNWHRRDFKAVMKCEKCSHIEEYRGYDDHNYYNNVIPDIKCKNCGESAFSLGTVQEKIKPRYDSSLII